jgi:hypothetical protein
MFIVIIKLLLLTHYYTTLEAGIVFKLINEKERSHSQKSYRILRNIKISIPFNIITTQFNCLFILR